MNLASSFAANVAKVEGTSAAHGKYPAGVVKRPNQYYIDPITIRVREGWNPRVDFGEIELLAGSIKSELDKDPASGGLINDIRVVRLAKPTDDGGIFEVVDGGRRLLAIQHLMKKGVKFPDGVPAKLESRDSTDLDKLIRMFTANTGKAFLPIEQAEAFRRMRAEKMTIAQIEKATGFSDNSIVGALALLDADGTLQDAVKAGKISGGMAKSIAVNARGDKAKQAELTAAALAAGKDKKAKKAVLVAIDDERRKKAKKQGKALKMRALSDDQLSAIGKKMAEMLVERMEAMDLPGDTDLTEWMKASDPDVGVAFAFGVLEGLKAAAGMPVDLVGV